MDLLASLLAVEPAQRCTCAQALRHDFFRRHLGPCTPGAPMPPAPAPANACQAPCPPRSPRSPLSPPAAPAAPALPHRDSLAALTDGCEEPRELLRRIKREVALCARSELRVQSVS